MLRSLWTAYSVNHHPRSAASDYRVHLPFHGSALGSHGDSLFPHHRYLSLNGRECIRISLPTIPSLFLHSYNLVLQGGHLPIQGHKVVSTRLIAINPLLIHALNLRPHVIGLSCNVCSLALQPSKSADANNYTNEANDCQDNVREIIRRNERIEIRVRLIGLPMFLATGCWLVWIGGPRCYWGRWWRIAWSILGCLCLVAGFGCLVLPIYGQPRFHKKDCYGDGNSNAHRKSVTQKHLTQSAFTYYNYSMANVLPMEKQVAVVGALCEGSSIRAIERQTQIHRDTIMRLGVRIGQVCTALMDAKMRDLNCTRLEMDEVWGFIGKKERHVKPGDDPTYGDVWTYCVIDADTKLVPTFRVAGDRDVKTTTAFVLDVADRMHNRLQISTDGLKAYVDAIGTAFSGDVDYGQIIKTYGTEQSVEAQRRYSAPKITGMEKKAIFGRFEFDLISTSYVERLNATTRLHMKRLARLTHAFSKKRENFEAAVGLHFAYYNFVRRHNTLRMTPAMAAGVERSFWSVADLVEAAA